MRILSTICLVGCHLDLYLSILLDNINSKFLRKENKMTAEYKQITNTGRAGDFVLEQQGGAEGFKNVSQFWMPNTLSYEDCLEQLEEGRSSREDIVGAWEDWEFVLEEGTLCLKNVDERVFIPTEHALNQAIGWSEVSQTHIKQTLSSEFDADETDKQQLVDMLNYRKQRNHQTNKNEERELIFRTYNDSTLRAVLTTQFTAVDNRFFVELMRDLIPGGRVSHLRGDSDTVLGIFFSPYIVWQQDISK